MPYSKSIETRFWEKVNKTDTCWLWTGAFSKRDGYGSFGFRDKIMSVHRCSWIMHYGEIPAGLWVLHKCDTPACVRPDHLFLGTRQDNVDDMWRKGRGSMGENHPKAKLNATLVVEIRAKRATGVFYKDLEAQYGVDSKALRALCNRKTWKHVL